MGGCGSQLLNLANFTKVNPAEFCTSPSALDHPPNVLEDFRIFARLCFERYKERWERQRYQHAEIGRDYKVAFFLYQVCDNVW